MRVIRENCKGKVALTLQWNTSEHQFGVCTYKSYKTPTSRNGRIIFAIQEVMYTMMTGKITIKQQRFLELYLGAEPGLSGNATKSYMAAYSCSERCAGASGPRLLDNIRINEAIAKHQEHLQEKIDVTAETVLRDAIRLRDIAFGDIPGTDERIVKDPETGEQIKVIAQLRQFNPQAVGKAIELMGRNRLVQAFRDSVEINHTHRLEELLNARTKKVEAATEVRRLRLVKDDSENISL